MDLDVNNLRTIKTRVEAYSRDIDSLVETLVRKYAKDLDDFIDETKSLLDEREDLTDADIEKIVLKVPIFLYYAGSGLETLGIESDQAKAVKLDVFNDAYLKAAGTIQDKTKRAELETMSEYVVEIAFQRAYKKLKTKVEMAVHVFSGAKKVLSKRMQDIDISKNEMGVKPQGGRYYD